MGKENNNIKYTHPPDAMYLVPSTYIIIMGIYLHFKIIFLNSFFVRRCSIFFLSNGRYLPNKSTNNKYE
jgi:hypothetical protein